MVNAEQLIVGGIALVFGGVLLLIVGALLGSSGDANVEGGGVVFIGPIPIVFGSNKNMAWLSLIIAGLMLAAYLLFYRT